MVAFLETVTGDEPEESSDEDDDDEDGESGRKTSSASGEGDEDEFAPIHAAVSATTAAERLCANLACVVLLRGLSDLMERDAVPLNLYGFNTEIDKEAEEEAALEGYGDEDWWKSVVEMATEEGNDSMLEMANDKLKVPGVS